MKIIAFVLLCLFAAAGPARAADLAYRVVSRYSVGGSADFGGVRVDSEARRIYVAHGDGVEVLNADSGEKIGTIAVRGARDIALAPEFKRGFISGGDSITSFDLESLKVVKTIKSTGQAPSAVAYDTSSKRIFAANSGSGDLTVIDPASGEVVSTVAVGGKLQGLASNGYGWLFASAEDRNVIHVVDTKSLKPLGDFKVAPGKGPTGLAIEPVTKRLFVGCDNGKLVVIDSDVGMVFTTLPFGPGPSGIICDRSEEPPPKGQAKWKGRVLAVASDGTLDIVKMASPVKWPLDGKTTTAPGAHSIAFDPKTNRAFVPAAPSGALELLVVGSNP